MRAGPATIRLAGVNDVRVRRLAWRIAKLGLEAGGEVGVGTKPDRMRHVTRPLPGPQPLVRPLQPITAQVLGRCQIQRAP